MTQISNYENQEMKECGLLTIQEIIDILGEDFCDYTLDVLSASGLYFVNNQIDCDDDEYLKEQEGQINVLKTKHHPEYNRDYKLPAHDVALSSASAPVYFPPHSFEFNNKFGSGNNVNMIDGGIFANNPALIGILEAADKLNINFSDIKVVSIGTGKGKQIIKKTWTPKNFWYWFVPKPRLLEMILDSQSQITDRYIDFLQRRLGKGSASFKYLRIQHEFGSDVVSLNASGKQDISRLENIGGELAKKEVEKIIKFLN